MFATNKMRKCIARKFNVCNCRDPSPGVQVAARAGTTELTVDVPRDRTPACSLLLLGREQ